MPARKAPTILAVSPDGYVNFQTPTGKQSTFLFHHCDKVTRIAATKFLGGRFVGRPPMHFSDIELAQVFHMAHLSSFGHNSDYSPMKFYPVGSSVPATVQPTVEPVSQEPIMSTKSTKSNGSSLDELLVGTITNVVNDILQDYQPTTVSTVDPVRMQELELCVKVLTDAMDEQNETIEKLSQRLLKQTPIQLVVNGVPSKPTQGVVHKQYGKIASAISLGLNVFLVGSAGTGKSTIPMQIAEQLGLEFRGNSCGTTDAKFDYVGYRDGHGILHSTAFRESFENGGLYLLDEMDNASADVLVTLNSALANGVMAFPDGMVKRHADFRLVATGNTWGNGATAQYVGRSAIDGATLDRFVRIMVDVDENVEDAMVDGVLPSTELALWKNVVRTARKNCEANGLRVMVTPRSMKHGAMLIAGGFTMQEAVDATFGAGLDKVQYDKVLAGVTL